MERAVNRILQAWKSWEDKQAEMEKTVGNGREHAQVISRMKLDHFTKCRNLLSADIRNDERSFLPLMNAAIQKLEREVRPNVLVRVLYRLKNMLVDKPAQLKKHERNRQENIAALKNQLTNAGFGDFAGNLDQQLNVAQAHHDILLSSQLDAERTLNVGLRFEKDGQDRFHLTTADTSIRHQENPAIGKSFCFKMEDWPGLNAKQVKNLLEGGAVRQEFTDVSGRRTSHWLELPENGTVAKRYTSAHGYDLQELLQGSQFDPLTYEKGKDALIAELQNGHQAMARWSQNGSFEPVFVRADPGSGTVRLSDHQQKLITPAELNKQLENRKQKQQAVIKQIANQPTLKQGKNRSHSIAH